MDNDTERLANIDLNLGQQVVAKRAHTKCTKVVFLKPVDYSWLKKQEPLCTPFAHVDGEIMYADCKVLAW